VLDAISGAEQLPPEALGAPARRAGREARGTRVAPRSAWLPRLALATGAAGLAAAAVLGGVTVSARDGQSAAQAQAQAIAAVLTAPDARLVSAPTSAGGSATVVASVRQGTMVFTSFGLRPLPGSRVYQLWFIGRTTRSAGLIPAASGGKTAPVLASELTAGDKIGVTVEPAGGSSAPTTAPIVLMILPARAGGRGFEKREFRGPQTRHRPPGSADSDGRWTAGDGSPWPEDPLYPGQRKLATCPAAMTTVPTGTPSSPQIV
jgi:anti-sigma-K factor RskA